MTQHLIRLGQSAIKAGNMSEAAQWFEKALEKNPKDYQSLACYGQSLCSLGQKKQGLVYLRESGRLISRSARKKKNISELISMTEQLQHWNDFEGAAELAKQAVQISKKEVRGFQLLALSYFRLSKNKQAMLACQQALRLVPDSAVLILLMATVEASDKKYQQARERLENLLQTELSPEEAYRTEKELANILDKTGLYTEVFPHLHRSAKLSANIKQIQIQDTELAPGKLVDNQTGFTKALLHRWSDIQFDGREAPVFVMGFMRSGTTLTQEVLNAHPDIFVADETDLIAALQLELNRLSRRTEPCSKQLQDIDLNDIIYLREFYWNRARMHFGDEFDNKCFVDKTTMNTIDLGLINAVFPDAKVIFVMRDPRDVCLSCFMQTMEPSPATVQLLSWQKTVDFYSQTMAWWLYARQNMSLDFLEVRYEDAVVNFEPTFQKVIDFLNLPWDPEVIEFHRYAAKKTIISPSFNQVTQPLYNSSLARWKNYSNEYQSVIDRLLPYISAFGYQVDKQPN